MRNSAISPSNKSRIDVATIFSAKGLLPTVSGITITCKSNSSDTQDWRFFENVGAVNFGTPLHSHPWDEGFYILEGEMELQVEDRIVSATPGYCINVPAGISHALRRSPGAKFLSWVSNTNAENFIQEWDRAMQESSLSRRLLEQIRHKYHILIDAIGAGVN